MYVIKMGNDKSLLTTIHASIYQGEKNADILIFLVPKLYGNQNIADCSMLLRYILPDGTGKSEELELDPEPYNDRYYRYKLKIGSKFTDTAGQMELWLSAISIRDNLIFKSDVATVDIIATKDITDYLSKADRDQLDTISEKVSRLEAEKADNIFYNKDAQYLQLTSQGEPIGDKVDMSTMENNDDVIGFDDESNRSDDPDAIIHF